MNKNIEDTLLFRKSKKEDVHNIIKIIDEAKAYFKDNNIDQWQNGYPNSDTILGDIEDGTAYVIESNNEILGTVMYSLEEESTYNSIYNGKWITSDEYAVMHRIAVTDKYKGAGIAAEILKIIEKMTMKNNVHSIRIDTHKDNLSMQSFLKKNGFKYCGEIYLEDGSLRIAFEKLI